MTRAIAFRLPRPLSALRTFLEGEAAGGILLIGAAVAAMLVANSPLRDGYERLLHAVLGPLSVHGWINDALMALFFLLVGLEIKRELVDGHLANWNARVLPGVAAAAGMAVPAALFLLVTRGEPALVRGWAIPSATDIAFAIGVLALLGSRAPASLKLFLTAVAIVDDMGAVAIIAIAYTGGLDWLALAAAAAILGGLFALNRAGVIRLLPYLLLGAALWFAVYRSGIHPTVAGVLTALFVPACRSPARPDDPRSPLHRLERALSPWIAFGVVPLFGFANAGVSLAGLGWADLLAPLPLGIAIALFVGKQLGVLGAIWGACRLGLAPRPAHASWLQLWGVSILCGIGFTMSLFIGGLAFAAPALQAEVRLGVLGGSVLSALLGALVLLAAHRRQA